MMAKAEAQDLSKRLCQHFGSILTDISEIDARKANATKEKDKVT